MRDALFHLRQVENISIQSQVREMLVSAILEGQLPANEPLPSSRKLARTLGVSRNTVVIAYQGLVDDGYLTSRERSGFYVNANIHDGTCPSPVSKTSSDDRSPRWRDHFRIRPSHQQNIQKPLQWLSYPYPFIYGQVDQDLFPIAEWRECSRQALTKKGMDAWTSDTHGSDDAMLVEQIRTRLLSRRGIQATNDEVLVTLGAQNALYLLASLLITDNTVVGMEDPGYPDVRNTFLLKTNRVQPIPVDDHGIVVNHRLDQCGYVYVTPSHQFPTTATMPLERRSSLLERSTAGDFLIIEDDYEFETNYVSEPTPALKTLDTANRVIYVGSLSKTLFPGLRLGYMVGPSELIEEARALRRLMLRHPPNNNQRTVALFLALGHHETMVHRLHRTYRERWQALGEALNKYLPDSSRAPTFGGTSFWVRGPEGLDAAELATQAMQKGVLIEPGRINFMAPDAPNNYFRLGFSSITTEKIEPGIRILADLINP